MVHPKWELVPGYKDRREAKPMRLRIFLMSILINCVVWVAILRLAACGRL